MWKYLVYLIFLAILALNFYGGLGWTDMSYLDVTVPKELLKKYKYAYWASYVLLIPLAVCIRNAVVYMPYLDCMNLQKRLEAYHNKQRTADGWLYKGESAVLFMVTWVFGFISVCLNISAGGMWTSISDFHADGRKHPGEPSILEIAHILYWISFVFFIVAVVPLCFVHPVQVLFSHNSTMDWLKKKQNTYTQINSQESEENSKLNA